jgi:hypothetical protein
MNLKSFVICLLLDNTTQSQSTAGFEQFDYVANHDGYAELRYNYDEVKTLSLYAGRAFSKKDSLSWSFTPMAGLLVGNWKGPSAGLNMTVNYGKDCLKRSNENL